jgi:adenosylcobinamide-GDP ribazoletransferase
MARSLILALQFLTRLPTPAVLDYRPHELGRSAVWFPLVGSIVGGIVYGAMTIGALRDPWVGALLGTITWVWVTGALHIDGLADMSDALGASHRDPQRFLEVLRDPHVGSFGVVAITLVIAAKLVLLSILLRDQFTSVMSIPLMGAWSRWGALAWSTVLPPLAAGSAERFAWQRRPLSMILWAAALLALSAVFSPLLMIAPLAVLAWGWFLKRRLGGMTGDCLGAGIEVTEVVLLLIVVARPSFVG